MKRFRVITVLFFCLCIALLTGTGKGIASNDEYQEEMGGYEEPAEGEYIDEGYIDEDYIDEGYIDEGTADGEAQHDEEAPYDEDAPYDDDQYMDYPDADRI